MIRKILIGLFVLLLSGCATNPYKQFYVDCTNGESVLNNTYLEPPPEVPKIFRGNNPDEDAQHIFEEGYYLIGHSSFNSSDVSDSTAVNYGKQIHAAMIIVYSKYTNTVSGAMPFTYPDTTTIHTNSIGTGLLSGSSSSSGNIYGPTGTAHYSGTSSGSGTASLFGSATTTVTQNKTTYIPYNINRYDYLATYWIKRKPPVLGIMSNDLSADQRKQIGTNKGIIVFVVVKGSPAFKADVFRGDIITKIDDNEIFGVKEFLEIVEKSQGKTIVLTLMRDGNTLTKSIQLGVREQAPVDNKEVAK